MFKDNVLMDPFTRSSHLLERICKLHRNLQQMNSNYGVVIPVTSNIQLTHNQQSPYLSLYMYKYPDAMMTL